MCWQPFARPLACRPITRTSLATGQLSLPRELPSATSWFNCGDRRVQRYTRILIGLAILICGCNRPASPPPAPAQSMAKPTAVPVQQVSTVEPAKKAEVDSPPEQAP